MKIKNKRFARSICGICLLGVFLFVLCNQTANRQTLHWPKYCTPNVRQKPATACAPVSFPNFFIEQMEEDVPHSSITQDAMEATWIAKQQNPLFIRYKWLNGRLWTGGRVVKQSRKLEQGYITRYLNVTNALETVLRAHPFPPLDFIVYLGDSLEDNKDPAPIFTFSKHKHGHNLILIPDSEGLSSIDRMCLSQSINKKGKKIAWQEKLDRIFWRGGATGTPPTDVQIQTECWHNAPRFHLVALAEHYPQQIDAAFTSWQDLQTNKERLQERFPLAAEVHPEEHLLYKYLIDVDGHTCCFSRTYWILLSNSLMFKQITDNVQWFYKGLVPFHHFIPLQKDLLDWEEKMVFAQTHVEQVQEIVSSSTEFARNYLSYEANLAYLDQVLQRYAAHLNYSPSLQEGDTKASRPVLTFYYKMKSILRHRVKVKPVLNTSGTTFVQMQNL